MRNLKIDYPTHTAAKMSREAMMLIWDEMIATSSAMVQCGSAIDYPSSDSGFCDSQIEGTLPLRAWSHAIPSFHDRDEVITPTLRAA